MYISIFLVFIFFVCLFYYIYKNKNNIVSYQTIKSPYKIDFDINKLNKSYHRNSCDDYCSKDLCNNYDIDLNNYIKCLECQKKLKCYNKLTNNCDFCFTFGIGQCKTPINPKNNLCR